VQNTKMHFLPHYMFELRSDNIDCCSFYESPKTRAVYETINANLGRDDSKRVQPLKDITPYIIETAWATWMPVPHNYNVWQPWFKGYYGVFTTGHFTPYRTHTFTWIDTDLKEKIMGD